MFMSQVDAAAASTDSSVTGGGPSILPPHAASDRIGDKRQRQSSANTPATDCAWSAGPNSDLLVRNDVAANGIALMVERLAPQRRSGNLLDAGLAPTLT